MVLCIVAKPGDAYGGAKACQKIDLPSLPYQHQRLHLRSSDCLAYRTIAAKLDTINDHAGSGVLLPDADAQTP